MSQLPPGNYFIHPIDAPAKGGLYTGLATCPTPEELPVTVERNGELWEVVKSGLDNAVRIQTTHPKYRSSRFKWFNKDNVLFVRLFGPGEDFTIESAGDDLWYFHTNGEQDLVLTYEAANYPTLTFQPPNRYSSAQRFKVIPRKGN